MDQRGTRLAILHWESGAGLARRLDQTGRSEGVVRTISPLSWNQSRMRQGMSKCWTLMLKRDKAYQIKTNTPYSKEHKKKERKTERNCVEAKEQRIRTETSCGRVQECLTSCQQTWLQSLLSSLSNTHRKHMGKHSGTVIHTQLHTNRTDSRDADTLSSPCTYRRQPYQHHHMSHALLNLLGLSLHSPH